MRRSDLPAFRQTGTSLSLTTGVNVRLSVAKVNFQNDNSNR